MKLEIIWVPSKNQLADIYTRKVFSKSKGVTGLFPPCPYPEILWRLFDPRDDSGHTHTFRQEAKRRIKYTPSE